MGRRNHIFSFFSNMVPFPNYAGTLILERKVINQFPGGRVAPDKAGILHRFPWSKLAGPPMRRRRMAKKRSPGKPDKPVPPARLKAELASLLSETGLETVGADLLLAFLSKGPPLHPVKIERRGEKPITLKWEPPATPRNLTLAQGMRIKKRLDGMRADHEDGKKPEADQSKKIAILKAAVLCGKSRHPLPRWITEGLEEIHRRYSTFEVRTIDEAFGVARPKGFHVGKMNEVLTKSLRVYFHVEKLRMAGDRVKVEFFDNVGREFGISATKAKEYYYAWRKKLGRMFPGDKTPLPRS
jgi:hypothetical protein